MNLQKLLVKAGCGGPSPNTVYDRFAQWPKDGGMGQGSRGVRYAQGGGLTDAERAARERTRLEAVGRFEEGSKNREIAAALRVSERSVERWRRQWRERGEEGVRSKGSPGRPRLCVAQIARLERELERGPLAHGWTDQRWTLARVKTLIGRLFHVGYTVEGRGGC